MKYVVTGTVDGRTEFPTERFDGFCYESWGNAWSMIDGIDAEYIPCHEIADNPSMIDDIDIIHCAWDVDEVLDVAIGNCFTIITEHGSSHNIDFIDNMPDKIRFREKINNVDLLLATTYGGKWYWPMFTATPVLNIPLPMDLNVFQPRGVEKFDKFTVSIGEFIVSCGADRPLQFQTICMLREIDAHIVTTIPEDKPIDKKLLFEMFNKAGLTENNITFYPPGDFKTMSQTYLPRSHASMMISIQPTFGRLAYVSSAIGVPCVGSFYQMHREICPELAFTYNEIEQMIEVLQKLRDDEEFYKTCVKTGLDNMRQMSNHSIATRICNEILPLITEKQNKYSYLKHHNSAIYDGKTVENPENE